MKKFETEIRPSRDMTLMDATLIGVGAMIGAGIFVFIGIASCRAPDGRGLNSVKAQGPS